MMRTFTSIGFLSLITLPCVLFAAARDAGSRPLPLTLEVVTALDPRLPAPSAKDVDEIVQAAQRVLADKFTPPVELHLTGRETMHLDRLFESVDYIGGPRFAEIQPFQYDLVRGRMAKNFQDPAYLEPRVDFFRNWSLDALADLFPYHKMTSHENFARALLQEYHRRIDWLKALRSPDGTRLVILPPVPHQSLTHWDAWAHAQDRYDVVLTNGLIILDTTASPYPHAVLKHAKSGGGTLNSPAREALGGMALVVSVLEDFGGVPQMGRVRPQRNRIVGEVLLAHEIAHAFFGMPDTYDHGDVCLMNSSAHALDNARILALLDRNPGPCAKCRPYVESKESVIAAREAVGRGMFDVAGSAYARALELYPVAQAGSQGAIYFPRLEEEARANLQRATLRAFTPPRTLPTPRTPPTPRTLRTLPAPPPSPGLRVLPGLPSDPDSP